jgi:5-methyltetrahydrofolate--homocysteine methyltransferase
MEERDEESILEMAGEQIDAGASAVDINAAMLLEEEEEVLRWAIDSVLGRFDGLLVSADSPSEDILLRAAAYYGERIILNSFSAEPDTIRRLSPVLAEHGSSAIIMLKDKAGIPENTERRLELALESAEILKGNDIKPERIFFDPVVTSIGTTGNGAQTFLETVRILNERLPRYAAVGGISNVSFGLPLRGILNGTFLAMAVANGIGAAICDPTDNMIRDIIKASEAVAGIDRRCRGFLEYYRQLERE